MRSSLALLLACGGVACTSLNPAYDDAGTGVGSGSGATSQGDVNGPGSGPGSGGSSDATRGTNGSLDDATVGDATDADPTSDTETLPGCEMTPPREGTLCQQVEPLVLPGECVSGPVLVADLDGDTFGEVLVACVGGPLVIYPGGPSGPGPGEALDDVGQSPRDIAVGNFDNVGELDVVVINETPFNSVRVFFDVLSAPMMVPFSAESPPTSVTTGPWFGPGIDDIAVTLPDELAGDLVQIMFNEGATFSMGLSVPVPEGARDVAMGPLNAPFVDDNIDLAVLSREANEVVVFFNDDMGGPGAPVALPGSAGPPEHLLLNDIEPNQTVDVLTVRSGDVPDLLVNRGMGDGNFGRGEPREIGMDIVGLGAGDFDGNNRPDAVFADYAAQRLVFLMLLDTMNMDLADGFVQLPSSPLYVSAGRLDGDSLDDAVASLEDGTLVVARTLP